MSEKSKRIGLIAAVCASILPPIGLTKFPEMVSAQSVALWVSAILGYSGIVLLLWMYLLGTKSVTALIFSDLAPVLKIHKWLGKYGTIGILLHPGLVTFGYGESLLLSVIPRIGTLAERHILLGQIAFWVLVVTWAMSAFLRSKIAFRPWKYLHYLAYICIPFALLHIPNLGSNFEAHVAVKAYFISLVVVWSVFVLLRLRSLLNIDRTRYTVTQHAPLTDGDFILRLAPNDPKFLRPNRGQYVYLKLGYISEDHPFSVTQFNPETGELTVAYRVFGMYTKVLQRVKEGTRVFLSGPYGSFMSDLSESDTRPVVYLAGGIGVTPFVDRIMNEAGVREQWLFAANRNRATAVLVPPLKEQLGDRCISVYNQQTEPLAPGEESGFISAEVLTRYLGEPTRYTYYLCGPPPMMKALTKTVTDLGVPAGNIHSETFGW